MWCRVHGDYWPVRRSERLKGWNSIARRFVSISGSGDARGRLRHFGLGDGRWRRTHRPSDVIERRSAPCRDDQLWSGWRHASRGSLRSGGLVRNILRLSYDLRRLNNHAGWIRSIRLFPGFVDAPEVDHGLEKFNLDIPFYSRYIPRAEHAANDIAPLRVRQDDSLAGR